MTYIDSASIGCLMDIYRLLQEKGGALRLSGVQPRVETMISMTGVHKIIDLHREEEAALAGLPRPTGARRCVRRGCPPATSSSLDGDLLGVLEALYREVTLKKALEVSFEDMMREIRGLVDQMDEEDAEAVPCGEPVPELRDLRERDARRLHAPPHLLAQEGEEP